MDLNETAALGRQFISDTMAQLSTSPARYSVYDGEKYEGGLGDVPITLTDYYALRQRSASFFKTNMYARGIIRRLVTNVINTGLSLEASPVSELVPLSDDDANEWAVNVESRFEAWGSLPEVCDFGGTYSFGELQRVAYREALLSGDVLIVERHNRATQLPTYQLINGSAVASPFNDTQLQEGHTIEYGVEMDKQRRHVAYWIMQPDLTFKRVKARGQNGRLLAWMYYATDKRHYEVRGEPLLSLVMQSIGEIDKYRDSAQRKATAGSLLTVFFYHSPDSKVPNSRPVTAGATRRTVGERTDDEGLPIRLNMANHLPGLSYEQLPPGMEPRGFSNDTTDEKFGEFEEAVAAGIAASLEMPPSIMRLTFDSSYSASRGEVKEFNLFLKKERDRFAEGFPRKVYRSWLVAMALTRRIQAPGLLESQRNPSRFEEYAGWTASDWYGVVKEAVDLPKEVKGQKGLVDNGWSTNKRASREMTGTRFDQNIKRVARENEMIANALRPLLELQQEFGADNVDAARSSVYDNLEGHIDD